MHCALPPTYIVVAHELTFQEQNQHNLLNKEEEVSCTHVNTIFPAVNSPKTV